MIFKKNLITQMTKRVRNISIHSKKIIVFPEIDERILHAASILIKKKICHPLILGNPGKIRMHLSSLKIKNFSDENIFDYMNSKNDFNDYVKKYQEIRKNDNKAITNEDAVKAIFQPHFYAAMMLNDGLADGVISGVNSETKPYFPAFHIIKTKENVRRASGVFLMIKKQKILLFADCTLNINPSSEDLAEIALLTAETAISFGIKPKVAMLSFSTHGTAKHEIVDKVRIATELVRKRDPDIIIDGEIQLDAALVPEVAAKKCPESPLQGEANVLIFPDLNSGNIGYKLVERLDGYKAIGPIMQGLNKPMNDLSRGCSVEDIVDLAVITIVQGL